MAATSASSSFAALLKQSKFASYSPAIAQVYITHGGHATRGDWGVKRPLSVRKRNKGLMIQSMDSREQQTEFRSAEPEKKMVQRWEETGVDVSPNANTLTSSVWEQRFADRPSRELGIDSEFGTYTTEKDRFAEPETPAGQSPALGVRTPASIEATPNFYTMSKKEFDKYVERVRKMRPAFRRYIQERRAENGSEETPQLYREQIVDEFDTLAAGFLNEMAQEVHGSSESQAIEPYPHRNGGLYYPQPNAFQTSLLHPSIPARFAHRDRFGGAYLATAAGMNAKVKPENNEDYTMLDWSRQNLNNAEEVENEHPHVRFLQVKLNRPPEVVSTLRSPATALSFSAPAASILRHKTEDLTTPPFTYPGGVKSMALDIEATTVRGQNARSNPYRPGSIPYSLEAPPDQASRQGKGLQAPRLARIDTRQLYPKSAKDASRSRLAMASSLEALLQKFTPGEDGEGKKEGQ